MPIDHLGDHLDNSQAQPCPIQAPYRLTHLIKDGSVCPQSTSSSSSIAECANDQQFRLHLAACSSYQQILGNHQQRHIACWSTTPCSLDLQFVCVGTWTEGFHTYFVARMLPPSRQEDNQYACFVSRALVQRLIVSVPLRSAFSKQSKGRRLVSSPQHGHGWFLSRSELEIYGDDHDSLFAE